MNRKKIDDVIFNGKCCNFSLVLVNDWLLKQNRWTPEKAMKLSGGLAKKINQTVKAFWAARVLKA